MDLIKAIFRGEKSLGFTYWICYIFPTLVVTVLIYILVASTFQLNDIPNLYDALRYLLIGLLLIVVFGSGIAVIRSAWYKKKAGFWGWIATLIVLLNMVRVPLELAGMTISNQNEIESETQKQITLMNLGLPKKVDEITTLVRVSLAEKIYTYHYKIDETFDGRIDLSIVKGRGINGICNEWKPLFDTKEVKSVEYRYLINGEVEAFFVTPTDCF